jgi:hypothetical protein
MVQKFDLNPGLGMHTPTIEEMRNPYGAGAKKKGKKAAEKEVEIPDVVLPKYIPVEIPHLIKEYDVIGFDVEHILANFNLAMMGKLVIAAHLKDLYENFNYPKEIFAIPFDGIDFEKSFEGAVVFDITKATVVSLTEGKKINWVMKGNSKLNDEEIQAIYGNPPVF